MIANFKYSQTKSNPHGCEFHFDCKYVISVEDEKNNRIKFVYKEGVLYVLSKNFNTLKIEYMPNE